MIEIQNLTKIFNKRVVGVDKISLSIEKGATFGLIGPNGSGKTTLLKLLSTILIPTSGTALINGYDVNSQQDKVRREIGLSLPGERAFYWRLTGRQNLEFFGVIQNVGQRLLSNRIEDLLREFGLIEVANRKVMEYFTGMKKKLNLARALLSSPSVLLLDEPTSGLHPNSVDEIRGIVRKFREEGKTILITSHNMDEVRILCDRVGVLNKGKLISGSYPGKFLTQIQLEFPNSQWGVESIKMT